MGLSNSLAVLNQGYHVTIHGFWLATIALEEHKTSKVVTTTLENIMPTCSLCKEEIGQDRQLYKLCMIDEEDGN